MKQYWFKRRRYGLGWVPVTWQGWLTIIVFIAIALGAAFGLPTKPAQPTGGQLLRFFVILAADLAAFLAITFTKGPRPRWRWGKTDRDDPDKDF